MNNNISNIRLLKNLENSDESVRRDAAVVIGENRIEEATPLLIKRLADESVGVAEAAAEALISIGGPKTAEGVASLLRSDEPVLRNFACEILEKTGGASLEILSEAMQDPDKDIRKFAADISGTIGSEKSVRHLLTLLEDKEINVAAAAADALGQIGDLNAVPGLTEAFSGGDWLKCSVAKALGTIGGEKALELLSDISQDEEDMVLYSVVNALANIGDEKTIKVLSRILWWNRSFLTGPIVCSLEKIFERVGDDEIRNIQDEIEIDPFLRILNDQDKEIRLSAVRMLGRMGNKKSFPNIVSVLLDKDEEIRKAAKETIIKLAPKDLSSILFILEAKEGSPEAKKLVVEIIGELRWEPGEKHLLSIYNDEDIMVRRAVVKGLGRIGNSEAVPALMTSLKDHDGHVRSEAALSLGRLGTESASDAIFELFNDSYKDTREAAAESLSNIMSESVREKINLLFHSSNPEIRRLALLAQSNEQELAKNFFEALTDNDSEVRRNALNFIKRALKRNRTLSLGERESEMICGLIDDKNIFVRLEAVSLMLFIDPKRGLGELLKRIDVEKEKRVKYEIVMNIGHIGSSDAVPALLTLLEDGDDLLRMAVLTALIKIGDHKSLDALEELLDDENPDIVNAVEKAIADKRLAISL